MVFIFNANFTDYPRINHPLGGIAIRLVGADDYIISFISYIVLCGNYICPMDLTEQQKATFFDLSIKAKLIFNPGTPVNEKDLFSGRKSQIRRVLDVVLQRGHHAIIFGERGVGKTSLANVLEGFFPPEAKLFSETRINCDGADSFNTVWRKVLSGMNLTTSEKSIGFKSEKITTEFDIASILNTDENITDQVMKSLIMISQSITPVIIIDEFDRLNVKVRRLFADFIKSLSDHSVNVTIIFIGVGDSVDDLIKEHESLSRNLVEIQMPRMSANEIEDIITTGLTRLGMKIAGNILSEIRLLAKGLPHYAHLLGLHASRVALDKFSLQITQDHLLTAIKKAVEDSNHSIVTKYHHGIRSTKKDNLFAAVLLACAKAEVNELGEFAAQDLRKPMKEITGKDYNIPAYAQHLNEFSESKRGNILIKSGTRKRFRYKFKDPLLQPFIIMKGLLKENS